MIFWSLNLSKIFDSQALSETNNDANSIVNTLKKK